MKDNQNDWSQAWRWDEEMDKMLMDLEQEMEEKKYELDNLGVDEIWDFELIQ